MADINTYLTPVKNNPTACTDCSIRRLALFNGIPESDLLWTQNYRSCQYKFPARQEIYTETQQSNFMYTIYHGWFAIYKTLENGKRQILKIALPGDMIGYQANFEAPMTYSAASLTDAVLCAFKRTDLPDLFRKNGNVARRLSEMNARDMHLCHSRLLTIGQHTAIEKVAHCCAEIFFRMKMIFSNSESDSIEFPLSQEDLGDMTGLTKIHVNRTLKQLREMGIMEISSRTLHVYDSEELCKVGYFDPVTINTYILY